MDKSITSGHLPFIGKLCIPEGSDDMLQDWWHQLQIENKSCHKRQCLDAIPFFAVSEQMVHSVFKVGNVLHQTLDVQLLTIELFDRFLCNDYSSKKETVRRNSTLNHKQKENVWLQSKMLMKDNFLSRILSCMQLASKHKSHFKIPSSPSLVYVEHLIYLLLPCNIVTDMNTLYSTCAHILAVAYTHHKMIYDSLYYIITSKKTQSRKERLGFLGVECDKVYLASAVILTATDLHKDNFSGVLLRLEELTDIPLQDIEALAAIIKEQLKQKKVRTLSVFSPTPD